RGDVTAGAVRGVVRRTASPSQGVLGAVACAAACCSSPPHHAVCCVVWEEPHHRPATLVRCGCTGERRHHLRAVDHEDLPGALRPGTSGPLRGTGCTYSRRG